LKNYSDKVVIKLLNTKENTSDRKNFDRIEADYSAALFALAKDNLPFAPYTDDALSRRHCGQVDECENYLTDT
jgi:hypothetical protein